MARDLPAGLASRLTWLDPDVALVPATGRWPVANGLLLRDGDAWTLVDAGASREILEGLVPHVDRVVLTHYHLDHVLHNDLFPLARVHVNEADLRGYRSADDYIAFSGRGPNEGALLRTFLQPTFRWLPDPAHTFRPGDVLETTHTRWRLVPVPGHTPGHVALHEPERGYLHGTDVEFSGLGPWYGWPHCDPDTFEEAVGALLKLDRRAVTTGHSPLIRGDAQAELEAFHRAFRERDEQVLAYLAKEGPATLPDLVEGTKLFYGAALDRNPVVRPWCATMTFKHLERLERAGRVRADGDDAWAVA